MTKILQPSEMELLAQLALSPTATADVLARRTKRKVSSVQYTLRKLKESYGLVVRPGINSYALGIQNIAVFFMPIFKTERSRTILIKAIRAHPKIPWCSEFVGSFQFGLNIHCSHISEVGGVLQDLCSKAEVSFAEKEISPRVAYFYLGRGYLLPKLDRRVVTENRYLGESRELDELERRILRVLAHEPFSSLRDVARIIGAPSSTVDQRVRILERDGVITGKFLQLDPKFLGRFVHRVMIETQLFDELDTERFHDTCLALPQVVYTNETLGRFDKELVVEVREAAELQSILGEFYRVFGPKIRSVKTLAEARGLKWSLL